MKNLFSFLFFLLSFWTISSGQQLRYDIYSNVKVVQSGNFVLTAGDLNASIEYMEFILAQRLSPEYRQAAQHSLSQQFQMNPAMIASEVYQVRQLLPSIIQLRDIGQIAAFRNSVLAQLHLQFMNSYNRPVLLQLADELNPILVYDAVSNICLTDRDLNGLIEFLNFGNTLLGKPSGTPLPSEKQQMIQMLETQLYSMSLPDKQSLLILADYVPLMKQAFYQLPTDQQEMVRQQYLQSLAQAQLKSQQENQCQGCSSKMKELYAKEARGELTQHDLAEMQREMQAQQNLFTMMSNSSLEHHATMLNVIDNLGGGNTLYEVKYNDW